MVMVSDNEMTNVAGKIACVTRTWIKVSVIDLGAVSSKPQRLSAKLISGLAKLAHSARHWPLFSVDFTIGRALCGASKLLASGIGANASERLILQKPMPIRRMGGDNTDFKGLQPVGIPQTFKGKTVAAMRFKAVKLWQGRWRVFFIPKLGKQHATSFYHRISVLLDAITQFDARVLGGCLQATAVGRKLQAAKRVS